MKLLLLWDIDGTLITSGGAGPRALRTSLRRGFGIDGDFSDIEFGGRTDPWILRAILRKYGVADTPENVDRLFDGYAAELPAELANPGAVVLPGVHAILDAAHAHGAIAQGLLTGNRHRGARVKLEHHGLWHRFAFGAFADDSEVRNELGPHAVRRAEAAHGARFVPDRVWIIGDTPHDIACGQAIGARTLAVGTGGHDLDTLRRHRPTAALPDLADTAGVLRIFEG